MFCLETVDRVPLSRHLIYIPSYSFLSYLDKVHIIKARYNATKIHRNNQGKGKIQVGKYDVRL